MKVYVAGASAEAELVASYIARLVAGGVEVTFDWTAEVLARRASGQTDADLAHEERLAAMYLDLEGAANADIFWLVCPSGASIGAWVELGYVIALNEIELLASGPSSRRTIFTATTKILPTHEEAIAYLLSFSQRPTLVPEGGES